MKRLIFLLTAIFICIIARSDEITINWMNTDKTIDHTTTCTIGGDVNVPIPTKYGYTFNGWLANYTPIEYLESTGTQYIDTGYVPNQHSGVKTQVMFNSIYNGNTVFGAGERTSVSRFELYIWNNSPEFNYSNIYKFASTMHNNDILTLYWDKNIVNYSINDGIQQKISFSNSSFTSPCSMFIFAFNRQGSIAPSGIKIYYFQIYDNDVLVRDFIPVLDKNGTPCMYDLVEGKFYYNAGTGQFIAGPVIGGD